MIDEICNKHIISQLVKQEIKKINWMEIIMGLIGGAGIGMAIGMMLGGFA